MSARVPDIRRTDSCPNFDLPSIRRVGSPSQPWPLEQCVATFPPIGNCGRSASSAPTTAQHQRNWDAAGDTAAFVNTTALTTIREMNRGTMPRPVQPIRPTPRRPLLLDMPEETRSSLLNKKSVAERKATLNELTAAERTEFFGKISCAERMAWLGLSTEVVAFAGQDRSELDRAVGKLFSESPRLRAIHDQAQQAEQAKRERSSRDQLKQLLISRHLESISVEVLGTP